MNQYIDHTLLKPEATREQIEKLCEEAKKYNFKSVCLNPSWVSYAKELLKDSGVLVCTVIGFPLGATSTQSKALETEVALKDGADEFDMVINIGALKENAEQANTLVQSDIRAVVDAANGKTVKVIFETCLLSNEEIQRACELSIKAGAHFVKTSTGFSTAGANLEVVKLMLDTVGSRALVKASGGVRSLEDAKIYIDMGVKRLGTSSGVAIMEGQETKGGY
ncbi:deoxyribose-phosphate aldolase [Bacteriovorax sp. Seq25_V]|uniref:deoxyribose-phosphate aldolase n=1 Tax=Bacteriovorax sp. Seq25_V TaxID=1201288 RepID=UPI00038A2FCD|nr:deoxyribose-phosphate aldolase [Bacteriovorax sp. Seq25_V]EQC46068.1 deoxyribose-phosphate aldolase [Bacteriovorax sp. Seq25_V]